MLLVWGCGEFAQHGQGRGVNVSPMDGVLEQFKQESIRLVACGASHTVAVTDDNKLFGWGNNSNGQLGLTVSRSGPRVYEKPQFVESFAEEIVGVSCASQESIIWFRGGSCIRLGNEYRNEGGGPGRKGFFDLGKWMKTAMAERAILQTSKVKHVTCGARHAMFLTESGLVYASGANNRGQLGSGNRVGTSAPMKVAKLPYFVKGIACGNFHSLCLSEEGDVYNWGYGPGCGSDDDVLYPALVPSVEEMLVSLAAGDSHSVALSIHGNIFAWGSNKEGQLEVSMSEAQTKVPINLSKLFQIGPSLEIACRDNTTATILKDGRLYMWGKNMWRILVGDKSTHCFIRAPFQVQTSCDSITKVALGSWHVAVISNEKRKDTEQKDLEQNRLTMATAEIHGVKLKHLNNYLQISTESDGYLYDMEEDVGQRPPEALEMEKQRTLGRSKQAPLEAGKCWSRDSFVLECVERENSLNQEQLNRTRSRSKPLRGSLVAEPSHFRIDVHSNISKTKRKEQIYREWHNDSNISNNRTWAGKALSRNFGNTKKNSAKQKPVTFNNSLTMGTWNIEFILDLTSRLQTPFTMDRHFEEEKTNIGCRRAENRDGLMSGQPVPSCDEILNLCSVVSTFVRGLCDHSVTIV